VSTIADSLLPVRLSIVGRFWDCQIYSGNLYLFGRDGSLQVVDWRRFVDDLPIPGELRMASEAALLGSSAYYSPDVLRVIQDPEIEPVVRQKFRKLEELSRDWTFNLTKFSRTGDNPFPFPHADSDFHYGSLYVGSRAGVFQLSNATFQKRATTPSQISDVPTLDLATKHGTVAVAAGSDGLFELRKRERVFSTERIAENVCSTCEWSYASIIGSHLGRSLFVATYAFVREKSVDIRSRKRVRAFSGIVDESALFTSRSASGDNYIEWGAKDRLYRYADGGFEVVKNSSNGAFSFSPLAPQRITTKFDLNSFVAVRVAPFGSVIEFDEHISVLLNSGEIFEIPGEPVSWRIYPRSMSYLNQLHVIYEDRMDIIAFTSDYLVRPSERYFGTEPVSVDERFG
jgi:hypothetical protein